MKRLRSTALLMLALGLFLSTSAFKQDLQQSRVKAAEPASAEFQRILARDLTAYFAQKFGPGISVQHELLRSAPAQAGTASPEFYAWVTVEKSRSKVDAGAVRGAVIDKKGVRVTEYLSEKIIANAPKSLEAVFPSSLWDDIRTRAKAKH